MGHENDFEAMTGCDEVVQTGRPCLEPKVMAGQLLALAKTSAHPEGPEAEILRDASSQLQEIAWEAERHERRKHELENLLNEPVSNGEYYVADDERSLMNYRSRRQYRRGDNGLPAFVQEFENTVEVLNNRAHNRVTDLRKAAAKVRRGFKPKKKGGWQIVPRRAIYELLKLIENGPDKA